MDSDRIKGKYLNYSAEGDGSFEKRRNNSSKNKKRSDYVEKNYSTTEENHQVPISNNAYRSPSSSFHYQPSLTRHRPVAPNSPSPATISNNDIHKFIQKRASQCRRARHSAENIRDAMKLVVDKGTRKIVNDNLSLILDDEDDGDNTSDENDCILVKDKDFEDDEADDEVDEIDEEFHFGFKTRHENDRGGSSPKSQDHQHRHYNQAAKKLSKNYKNIGEKRYCRNEEGIQDEYSGDDRTRVATAAAGQPIRRSTWSRHQVQYQDSEARAKPKIKKFEDTGVTRFYERRCPECGQSLVDAPKAFDSKKASHKKPIHDFAYDIDHLTEATSKMRCSTKTNFKNYDTKSSLRPSKQKNLKIDTRYRE